VSTNTINLQEQLVGKDLPFLARALSDQPVRFALLKGWRNYLCLLRLEQARSTGAALFEESLGTEIAALTAWAERTTDGSLSDLAAPPRGEVWDEVSAEPDLCTRMRCPHYERCFLFAARRKAAQADVIVVNHHLLMSDVAVRRVSQNWDDAASCRPMRGSSSTKAITWRTPRRVTLALPSRDGRCSVCSRDSIVREGILPSAHGEARRGKGSAQLASLDLARTKLAPAVLAARDRSNLVFDLLATMLEETGVPVMRLTEDFANHRVWRGGLDLALTELLGEVELLQDGLRVVRERIETDAARAEAVGRC
jgi:ATP-dependent DNA helicase DinG